MAHLEVLIGALAAFMLGFLWYTALFGKEWQRLTGVTDEQAQSGMAITHGLAFLMMCVLSFGINFIINMHQPEEQTFVHGGFHGLLIGLMYCVPAMTINYLYQKKPLKLFLIDGAYLALFCALSGGVMAVLNLGGGA